MLDEFVKQVKRLFSSKNNAGKLVYNQANWLHNLKLVALGLSIVLLVGYAQFRDNFHCQGTKDFDKKFTGNFCWINGTKTVDPDATGGRRPAGHIGLNFYPDDSSSSSNNNNNNNNNERDADESNQIDHNYMRSIWLLLFFMVICSYLPQHIWSRNFDNEILKVQLKLPGHDELALTKRVREIRPCDTRKLVPTSARSPPAADAQGRTRNGDTIVALQLLPASVNQQAETKLELLQPLDSAPGEQKAEEAQSGSGAVGETADKLPQLGTGEAARLLRANEQQQQQQHLSQQTWDLCTGDENEYNHTLDHYVDQLFYLLAPIKPSAYKLADMKLRRKLYTHSMVSLTMSCLQFILPILFVGGEYITYGLNFTRVMLHHVSQQLSSPNMRVSAIDYELSGRIFPVMTICEYLLSGINGKLERRSVLCTLPMSEICGKIFAALWWAAILTIVIEFYHFVSLISGTFSFNRASDFLASRYWPQARAQADYLASFRYRRHKALKRANKRRRIEASSGEQKRLEAELGDDLDASDRNKLNRWYLCNTQFGFCPAKSNGDKDLASSCYLSMPEGPDQAVVTRSNARSSTEDEDDEGTEKRHDINVYLLLYLIHMRNGASIKDTEQIIRKCAKALGEYEQYFYKSIEQE